MKKFVIGYLLLAVVAFAAAPTLDNFNRRHFRITTDFGTAASNVIQTRLSSSNFSTTGDTWSLTNVVGATGASHWTNYPIGGGQFRLEPRHDLDYHYLYPSNFVSHGWNAKEPQLTLLSLGTNLLSSDLHSSFLLISPTNDASQVVIQLTEGAIAGQELDLLSYTNFGGQFVLLHDSPVAGSGGRVILHNGQHWLGQSGAILELKYIYPDWWEVGRDQAGTNITTNTFQFISVNQITVLTNITINGTNVAVVNPTDNYVPYRINASSFGDSLLEYRDTNYMTLHGFGAGLFIGSHAEAYYGGGLTGEAIVAANIVAEGDPDDVEMLITSVDGSNSGEFHVSGSSLGMTTQLSVNGANPSQLSLTSKGIHQRLDSGDFHFNLDPFGLIAAPAPFYFNQDAVFVNPTDVIALIQYRTNTIFRLNRDSGYAGGGTLFLSDDGTYKSAGATTINPSDTFIPYRSNSTTFADSPMAVTSASNVRVDGSITFGGTSSSHPMIRRYFSTDAVAFRNGDDSGFGEAIADRVYAEDALYSQLGTSAAYGAAPVTFLVVPTTVASPVSTETNLLNYSLPANVLSAQNARLLIRASGTFAANANNKRVRVYFGATAIFDSTSLGFNGGTWVVNGEVIRVNNTSQVANVTWNSSNTTLSSSANYAAPGATLSGTVLVAISTESDSAGDISLRTVSLTYAPEY